MKNRRCGGSITAFGVVLAMVLCLLGGGFLFFMLFMGGQREIQNAVDAGTLNIGKEILEHVAVNLSDAPNQKCFLDATSDTIDNTNGDDNKINLRRINRVWGEAMLMTINAQAAGGNAGSGNANAQMACVGAKQISDALADKLSNASNLYNFFTTLTHSNSVRMLGTQVSTEAASGEGWQTSLMNRQSESNIVLNGAPPNFNLPPQFTLPPAVYTKSKRANVPAEATDFYFLKGYTPLTIGNQTFWQVPFQYDEKPHLVSQQAFNAALPIVNPLLWSKPVANAYSAEGQAIKGDSGEKARSWVLTNPRQAIQLAIPHGFVQIHLDEQQSHWYFFPAGPPPLSASEYGSPQTYGYATDFQSSAMPQGGVCCSLVDSGEITVGTDVAFKSLDQVIFADYINNKTEIENYLTNRINEMITKPGISKSSADLHNILSQQSTVMQLVDGNRDFYLYSPDGENIVVGSKSSAMAIPWLAPLISHTPDGNEQKLVDDASKAGSGSFPTVTPNGGCTVDVDMGWSNIHEDVYWTPGTGFNSCLGLLRIKHWTNIYSLGVCS